MTCATSPLTHKCMIWPNVEADSADGVHKCALVRSLPDSAPHKSHSCEVVQMRRAHGAPVFLLHAAWRFRAPIRTSRAQRDARATHPFRTLRALRHGHALSAPPGSLRSPRPRPRPPRPFPQNPTWSDKRRHLLLRTRRQFACDAPPNFRWRLSLRALSEVTLSSFDRRPAHGRRHRTRAQHSTPQKKQGFAHGGVRETMLTIVCRSPHVRSLVRSIVSRRTTQLAKTIESPFVLIILRYQTLRSAKESRKEQGI